MRINRSQFISLLIIFTIVILIGTLSVKKQLLKQKLFYKNYPLVKFEIEYRGFVFKRYYTHSRTFVEIENGTKYSFPWAYNFQNNPYFLGDFLIIGDFILKPANTDTLYVFRGEQKYFFVLEKRINK